MSGEDIRKLLGGYATGTLSADEQKALFEAALHDEKLFAALADEHALREMLDDPGHRAALLRALEPQAAQARGWGLRWMVPAGIAAGLVVIASVVFVFQRPAQRGTVEMAKVVQPALQPEVQLERPATAPAAAPVPAPKLSDGRRQVMDRAPAEAPRRDAREERRAEPLEEPKAVVLSSPGVAGPAPAAAPAPPLPGVSETKELESAKKESVGVQSQSVYVNSGSGGFLGTGQGLPGTVNSAGKVQYTILKRGADGQFKPINAASTLQPADAVRLNIETEEAGFLSVSQKEPSKMLFEGAVQKQVPVTIPATGSLDLSNRGALQIMFSQPNAAGGLQNALLPDPSSSKRKGMAKATSEKLANGSKDQTPGVITVDVNLNVATPAQQQK